MVLGIVLLLRDVLARSLFVRYQEDRGLLDRVLDAYEPAANRIAVTVGVSFVQERERVIREQQVAIQELSTPVLQVRERLLILPIIGVLDSGRARQLTEQLRQGEKLKAEFVATMSHELRTPLNVVLGFGSLLADEAFGALNQDQAEACQKIMESTERLATLINDLLDWSRQEASTLEFNMTRFDIGRLSEGVIADMRPLADRKELTLALELGADLPLLTADPDRVEQVLKHLLDNAVKFTPNGGRVSLTVTHLPDNGAIALDVVDGRPTLVLADAGGRSLRSAMARERWTLGEVLAIATRIAEQLEAVHQRGVVHRDLNPDNVVLLPHLGSNALETRTAMGMRVAKNLERFFAGDAPPDRVA